MRAAIKKIEFYQKKNCQSWSHLKIDNHSINSRNYATAYHQTLEEVPRTLVPEKRIKKFKDSKNLKTMQMFSKSAIKIFKNIPLYLKAMY